MKFAFVRAVVLYAALYCHSIVVPEVTDCVTALDSPAASVPSEDVTLLIHAPPSILYCMWK